MTKIRHTDVVGSLLRPSYLMNAFARRMAGDLSRSGFKKTEDAAVDQSIALQEAVGMEVVTDGEMRRMVFLEQLITGINGTAQVSAPAVPLRDAEGNVEEFKSPVSVAGRISSRRSVTTEEYVYARARARVAVKATVPSPFLLWVLWSPESSPEAYPDPFDLFLDAAKVVRDEVEELAALGCTHIQVDAPEILQLNADPEMRATFERLGLPVDRILNEGADLVNGIVGDLDGVEVSLHFCRANFQSKWLAEGGYAETVKNVVPKLTNVDRFLLEYDDERSGSFAPLADVPDDKVLVLGLVSSKLDAVESPDQVADRVREAANYVDLDRLALSTACGFASDATGNLVSRESQEQKLRVVVEAAKRVWG